MNIKTDFNIGDVFYTMIDNSIKEIRLSKITIDIFSEESICLDYMFDVWYVDKKNPDRSFEDRNYSKVKFNEQDFESKFFKTREELINTL